MKSAVITILSNNGWILFDTKIISSDCGTMRLYYLEWPKESTPKEAFRECCNEANLNEQPYNSLKSCEYYTCVA